MLWLRPLHMIHHLICVLHLQGQQTTRWIGHIRDTTTLLVTNDTSMSTLLLGTQPNYTFVFSPDKDKTLTAFVVFCVSRFCSFRLTQKNYRDRKEIGFVH